MTNNNYRVYTLFYHPQNKYVRMNKQEKGKTIEVFIRYVYGIPSTATYICISSASLTLGIYHIIFVA